MCTVLHKDSPATLVALLCSQTSAAVAKALAFAKRHAGASQITGHLAGSHVHSAS